MQERSHEQPFLIAAAPKSFRQDLMRLHHNALRCALHTLGFLDKGEHCHHTLSPPPHRRYSWPEPNPTVRRTFSAALSDTESHRKHFQPDRKAAVRRIVWRCQALTASARAPLSDSTPARENAIHFLSHDTAAKEIYTLSLRDADCR